MMNIHVPSIIIQHFQYGGSLVMQWEANLGTLNIATKSSIPIVSSQDKDSVQLVMNNGHDKLFLVAIVFKQLRITTVFSSMQNYSYYYTVLTDQNVCGAKFLHILCYLSDWCDGMAFPKMFSWNFAFQPIHEKFAPRKLHATQYLFGVLPTILYHNVHSTNEQTRMYSVTAPQAYN